MGLMMSLNAPRLAASPRTDAPGSANVFLAVPDGADQQ
jgi:hypothetical protein